jgi:hypothetical protein
MVEASVKGSTAAMGEWKGTAKREGADPMGTGSLHHPEKPS